MKVKLIGFSMVMLLACAGVSLVYANQCHSEHSGMKEGLSYDKALLDTIEVGNKICPVSGEDIESMGVGIEYEYNGKIYNFCCSMCIEKFKKDPGGYIKKIEKEKQKLKN